jgi:hypothetical protein
MKTMLHIVTAAALFLFAGCFPPASVNGLYTEETIATEPALVGSWDDPDETEDEFSLEITADDDNAYMMRATDASGAEYTFELYVTEINGTKYIDFFPDDYNPEIADLFVAHLLPLHTFYKLEFSGDTLLLTALDGDWVQETLSAATEAYDYMEIDDRIIFTGPPEVLRKFVSTYATSEEAFGQPLKLLRMKE